MSKKEFGIILVLSVIATYGLAFIEALMNPLLSQSGLPFKFGSYTLFGEATTSYPTLILDIIFWFVIIFGIWKLLQKVLKK